MKKSNGPNLENIQVETDDTDHFHFICPSCGVILKVERYVLINDGKQLLFILQCEICKGSGTRKITLTEFHKIEDLRNQLCNKHITR